ncbi:hypothetical protein [Ammoniphilus sp. 3BR4]|uniref:hypothetical protein n=1 Tax=Ammoniphilus sp. 3BR4 TaxID=3158265 RepID=UPI003466C694
MKRKDLALILVLLVSFGVGQSISAEKLYDIFKLISNELKSKTNFPVLLPRYWPPISPRTSFKYPGITYEVSENSYAVTVTATSQPYPVNDPRLSQPPNDSEANKWGSVSGQNSDIFQPLEKPRNVVKVKIGNVFILAHPSGVEYYWERDAWRYKVVASSIEALELSKELIEATNKNDGLSSLNAKKGKVYVAYPRIYIQWVSEDGNTYSIFTKANITESIRIANSLYVN